VTITKSISIICDGGRGRRLGLSGTNGITVTNPRGSVVYLSGLDIEGLGTGLSGISFVGSGALQRQ